MITGSRLLIYQNQVMPPDTEKLILKKAMNKTNSPTFRFNATLKDTFSHLITLKIKYIN